MASFRNTINSVIAMKMLWNKPPQNLVAGNNNHICTWNCRVSWCGSAICCVASRPVGFACLSASLDKWASLGRVLLVGLAQRTFMNTWVLLMTRLGSGALWFLATFFSQNKPNGKAQVQGQGGTFHSQWSKDKGVYVRRVRIGAIINLS